MKIPSAEIKTAGWLAALLCVLYYLPVGTPRFDGAVKESLGLAKWYAREHVILCLLPAFFIAGAIGAFVSQSSVIRYLGGKARRGVQHRHRGGDGLVVPQRGERTKDYKLSSKTVVISRRLDGRQTAWMDMEKVWDLLDDPQTYHAYLGERIRQYLGS